MQELRLLNETTNTISLYCKSLENFERHVEGFNSNFVYTRLPEVVDDVTIIEKSKDFIGYRIVYECVDGLHHYLVDRTNTIFVEQSFDIIDVKILSVPDGRLSLSFCSDKHYDLYRFFNKNDVCLCETKDCIILGDFCDLEGYVCGYVLKDDSYILNAISNEFTCIAESILAHDVDLSVIIPVYNSFSFLPRTLQSILSSTFVNLEIILIDDGSNEATAVLCDEYADMYPNIIVYHQSNNGVCSARNKGLDIAAGRWIAFVDNDDIVHPYMYEKLMNAAVAGSYDIAIAQCVMHKNYNETSYVLSSTIDDNIITMDSYADMMDGKYRLKNVYFVAIWNKIVKADLARKVRFASDMPYYEDTAYTSALYTYINRYVLVKDAYYIWDKRKQLTEGTASTTHYKRSPEVVWKYYILSYVSPLYCGNQDENISKIYKYDIVQHLLTKFREYKFTGPTKCVFYGMLKYLHRIYDLPFEQLLLSSDDSVRKLYDIWSDVQSSSIIEWDGNGAVPSEYY